jgi:hypothetical protein
MRGGMQRAVSSCRALPDGCGRVLIKSINYKAQSATPIANWHYLFDIKVFCRAWRQKSVDSEEYARTCLVHDSDNLHSMRNQSKFRNPGNDIRQSALCEYCALFPFPFSLEIKKLKTDSKRKTTGRKMKWCS